LIVEYTRSGVLNFFDSRGSGVENPVESCPSFGGVILQNLGSYFLGQRSVAGSGVPPRVVIMPNLVVLGQTVSYKGKIKVHTFDISPLCCESPPQKRSGVACVLKRSHSFTCTPTRSSAIGMSHISLCLPRRSCTYGCTSKIGRALGPRPLVLGVAHP